MPTLNGLQSIPTWTKDCINHKNKKELISFVDYLSLFSVLKVITGGKASPVRKEKNFKIFKITRGSRNPKKKKNGVPPPPVKRFYGGNPLFFFFFTPVFF